MTTNDRITAVTEGQLGAITRRQVSAAGVTRAQLRSRVRSGFLVPDGTRTYRRPTAARTSLGQLNALILDVGEPCYASGASAAALHGFDGFELAAPFHLVVPRGRNVVRVGHVLHTALHLERHDLTTVLGVPALTPTRTLIDLARSHDTRTLTVAYESALRDRLTHERVLHQRIVDLQRQGRYRLPRLLDAMSGSEVVSGAHSWLERRFLELLDGAGLPRPACQEVLARAGDRMVRVDCHFPGTMVVVELLGYAFHRTTAQMQRDTERANALTLEGFVVYQFTYRDVVGREDYVVDTVEQALMSPIWSIDRPSR